MMSMHKIGCLSESLLSTLKSDTKLRNLIKVSEDIFDNSAYLSGNIFYYPSGFIAIPFPAKKTEGNVYEYFNGKFRSRIISDPEFGIPYGKIPRVLCMWITTQVVLNRSHHIYLGKNMNALMEKLGVCMSDGPRGNINRLIEQANRLFRSSIIFDRKDKGVVSYENLFIMRRVTSLIRKKDGGAWQAYVEVSEDFFNLCKSSVPIDIRVVKAIRSPVAIDFYVWLTWQMNRLNRFNKKVYFLSWDELFLRFGYGYMRSAMGKAHFKQSFLKSLRDINLLYPDAKYDILTEGIVFLKSKPHIKKTYK